MKKFWILLLVYLSFATTCFAGKIPTDIENILKKSFPSVDIRFDGVIILPDGTIYLPLYPAKIKNPEETLVAKTFPENTDITQKPDAVIFNNDFALLKVLTNNDGTKTVMKFDKIPNEIRTGILPQDMLIPKNLIIPENMKTIAGNLSIKISPEKNIKIAPIEMDNEKSKTKILSIKQSNKVGSVPELKEKVLYVLTHYTKDIQVVNAENNTPEYALAQKTIPNKVAITPDNKFLLVTTFNSTLLNIISLADDMIIKQLDLTTVGGDIVIDEKSNCAYVASPNASTIYQVALSDMTLKKKVKVNGRCEKLALADGYMIYIDKLTNKIWSIELDNEYTLKDLGIYPNISKIVYSNGRVFVTSRTKSRVAVIDYKNQTLLAEFDSVKKPTDMVEYKGALFILSSEENIIQVINTNNFEQIAMIQLGNDGFSTRFVQIPNSKIVLIPDAKQGMYSIVDLQKKSFLKTNVLTLPVSNIVVGKNIRKL